MEIDRKYANAYVEVLEILKYVDKQDYNKIPSDEIELLETYSNKNYSFTYNPEKSLDEQNVSETTKLIIAMLFLDYWASQKQKKKINTFIQNKRDELYDTNNLFKNSKAEKVAEQEVSLVKYKEGNFLTRLFNRIKRFFSKNKE